MSANDKLRLIRQSLRNAYFFLLPLSNQRRKFLYKHQVFAELGRDLFWQPRRLPSDPKCIKLHNNVVVASDVTFINHDVIYILARGMGRTNCKEQLKCIEIMDNCFIGMNATIMPGVRIGPNAIVSAGAIVTKDVLPGTVVGGVPAKVIGSFEDVLEKQLRASQAIATDDRFDKGRIAQAWEEFEKHHALAGKESRA